MQAKVAQDVVLHATIQRRKAGQRAAKVILGPRVEVDDVTDADLRHKVLEFWRRQRVKTGLQRHFFRRRAEQHRTVPSSRT